MKTVKTVNVARRPSISLKLHGTNGSWIEDAARPAKAAVSPSFEMVDTLGEPTAREVAYWSIQEDRLLWPAEA